MNNAHEARFRVVSDLHLGLDDRISEDVKNRPKHALGKRVHFFEFMTIWRFWRNRLVIFLNF